MLMNTLAVTSVLAMAPFAQVAPEPTEEAQRVQDAQRVQNEVADVAPQAEPVQPLIGPREKLAMGLLRQLVPIERQRDYDDAVTILESVATTVDEVRERRGDDRRRPAFQSRRRADRRDAASGRDSLGGRDPLSGRDDVREAEVNGSDEARRQSFQRRNGNVFEMLMRKRRELQEAVAREQAEQRLNERERNDELDDSAEHRDLRANRIHDNPFRPGEGDDVDDAARDFHERERRSADRNIHEHGNHDHDHPHPERAHRGHRAGGPMNLQDHLERAERETHVLRLEAARMELSAERSRLLAQSVAEPEVTAIWAVERMIEVFGDDAPVLLAELKLGTESPIVRRFITFRLAELAGRDRDAAIAPLSELVTGDN